MHNQPSTEERVWAVLSHLSAIAFGMGILLPIIGWSEQRRKSRYASFQCLQALGYQSLGYTIWILAALVIFVALIFITLAELGAASSSGEDITSLLAPTMILHFVVMMGLIGLYVLLPFIAAIACALGKDFRYPIMGNRLARYLGFDSEGEAWLNENHEDRWVAAMGHFGVIIIIWGMLIPLTAWILQGGRGLFLKFQSIQTLVYQAGVTLLFFSSGFVYLFGFVAFAVMFALNGAGDINFMGILGLVVLGLSLALAFAIILIVPLFHILGQWAGYRVLKGDDYHYPVVGRLVARRVMNE